MGRISLVHCVPFRETVSSQSLHGATLAGTLASLCRCIRSSLFQTDSSVTIRICSCMVLSRLFFRLVVQLFSSVLELVVFSILPYLPIHELNRLLESEFPIAVFVRSFLNSICHTFCTLSEFPSFRLKKLRCLLSLCFEIFFQLVRADMTIPIGICMLFDPVRPFRCLCRRRKSFLPHRVLFVEFPSSLQDRLCGSCGTRIHDFFSCATEICDPIGNGSNSQLLTEKGAEDYTIVPQEVIFKTWP